MLLNNFDVQSDIENKYNSQNGLPGIPRKKQNPGKSLQPSLLDQSGIPQQGIPRTGPNVQIVEPCLGDALDGVKS